jgi:hypothetical protein
MRAEFARARGDGLIAQRTKQRLNFWLFHCPAALGRKSTRYQFGGL